MSSDELSLLIERLLALPPEERSAFIQQACQDDTALCDKLTSFLQDHQEAEAYFKELADAILPDMPTVKAVAAADEYIGRTLGHYRITAKLGEGGMGVVYRAEDTHLNNRPVALKVLPTAALGNPEARERFAHEARAAAALNHANICTIYYTDEIDGRMFLAMEYVEGQTLRDRVTAGPLSPEEALAIVRQMADGLRVAHRRGIIHRDIKPGNVMLTPEGLVKLLDFGLAKVVDISLTQPGTLLGTPAYMSPEQFRGEPADAQSDIWAVGVVLYEMLAGERPFQGDSWSSLYHQVVSGPLPPLQEQNPSLPESLVRVVDGCLQRDPAQRYASAAALLADLDAIAEAGKLQGDAVPADRPGSAPARWPHAKILGSMVGIVTVVALLMLGQVSGPDTARTYVAVLASASEDPAHQALAEGLIQSVADVLVTFEAARDSLWVVPASEIQEQRITSATQAREVFGVNRVVRVVVRADADSLHVSLDLEDVVMPRVLESRALPAPSHAAFQQHVLEALAAMFHLTPPTVMAGKDLYTNSDAFFSYTQGMGFLIRYDLPGNIDHAIAMFEQAIRADSTFAPAHAGLCEAQWEKHEGTRDPAWVLEAMAACEKATVLGGDDPAVLVSLGRIYFGQGQHDKAVAALQRARSLAPGNAQALRWLGRTYEDQADHAAAEEAYQEAIALQPNVWIWYYELGVLYNFTGEYEQAQRQYEEAQHLAPDSYLPVVSLGNLHLNQGQFTGAIAKYQRANMLHATSLGYRNMGLVYMLDQQHDKATDVLEQALELTPADLIALTWLGDAAYWGGETEKARAAWQEVLDRALTALQVNSNDQYALFHVANAHAGLGNTEESLLALERVIALPQVELMLTFMIGRTYERLGQRALAFDWISRSIQNGFTPVLLQHDPWLEDFRQDPRYGTLL